VWWKIAADGSRICINKPGMLAMDIGELTESCAGTTIYHADGTSTASPVVPFTVKNGDILDTPAGGCATIAFEDFSVLRLGEETTLSLDVGTVMPSGELVANILMDNGQVWGRILTETGSYNIGDGTVTAAVRGTSISLEKTGATIAFTNPTGDEWIRTKSGVQRPLSLNVVDSTIASDSVEISCAGVAGGLLQKIKLDPRMTVSNTSGCPTIWTLKPRGDSFSQNRWVRENTKRDIVYLADRAKRQDISDQKQTRIQNELLSSNLGDASECTHLLSGTAVNEEGGVWVGSVSSSICNEVIQETNPMNKYFRTACALRKKVYWKTVSDGERLDEICQDEGVVAFVDYTSLSRDMILSGSTISPKLDWRDTTNDGKLQEDGNFFTVWKDTEYSLTEIINRSIQMNYNWSNWFRGDMNTRKNQWYDTILVKSSGWYKYDNESWWVWDFWKYPSGIFYSYSTSNPKQVPNILLTSSGLPISGTWFIAYPLSQLPDLRGKKITIELNSGYVDSALSKYLWDFWDMRYYIASSKIYRKIGTGAALQIGTVSIWQKIFSITIGNTDVLSEFIIWNNVVGWVPENKSIGNSIKTIKIEGNL
jgi:FecR protein